MAENPFTLLGIKIPESYDDLAKMSDADIKAAYRAAVRRARPKGDTTVQKCKDAYGQLKTKADRMLYWSGFGEEEKKEEAGEGGGGEESKDKEHAQYPELPPGYDDLLKATSLTDWMRLARDTGDWKLNGIGFLVFRWASQTRHSHVDMMHKIVTEREEEPWMIALIKGLLTDSSIGDYDYGMESWCNDILQKHISAPREIEALARCISAVIRAA